MKTMKVFFAIIVASCACFADAYPETLQSDIRAAVQPVLDYWSNRFNTSFSFGIRSYDGVLDLGLASGIADHSTGARISPESVVPIGSVTKSYTAAAIMQLVERGMVNLNDTVSDIVNAALVKNHGTTLEKLWVGEGSMISNVTIYQCLHMSAGLNDYNDAHYQAFTFKNPPRDYTPFDMIENFNKSFVCAPGRCSYYSSVGYELLGLVLAAKSTQAQFWKDLKQSHVLPAGFIRSELNRTLFPITGECASYVAKQGMIHQYQVNINDAGKVSFRDITPYSCLNGWTCGNVAAPALDVARFFAYLGSGRIVSEHSLALMSHFDPLTKGFAPGTPYGLGLHLQGIRTVEGSPNPEYAQMIGHGGMDWGSNSELNGFLPNLELAMSISMGSSHGMNCSLLPGGFEENMYAATIVNCNVAQKVFQVLNASIPELRHRVPAIDCSPPKHPLRPQASSSSSAPLHQRLHC